MVEMSSSEAARSAGEDRASLSSRVLVSLRMIGGIFGGVISFFIVRWCKRVESLMRVNTFDLVSKWMEIT